MKHDMCHDVRLQTFFEAHYGATRLQLAACVNNNAEKCETGLPSLCSLNSAGRTRTIESQGGLELGKIGH